MVVPPRDEQIARMNGWPGPATTTITGVVAVFQRWLYLPDPGSLLVVLAAVVANRMTGDPVWLALVGPPGGGKTEIVLALGALKEVHHTATLTEAALLSGTPGREKAKDATGGLLRQVGQYGLIICKDFTSVLAMNKDSRGSVLAALREVFDGAWTRQVGTDGGRTLHWEGKAGLIAGCTPSIDRHHGVMAAMGERLVFYRLATDDQDELADSALDHVGSEHEMRHELRQAVADLFDRLEIPAAPPPLSDTDRKRLVAISGLVARARSSVERDGYRREIELIPDAEAPTRLVGVLARLLGSLCVLGVTEATAWRLVAKVGLDSVPALRMRVLDYLASAGEEWQTTTSVATACGYPTSTAVRALEDLAAHRVVQRRSGGPGKADEWTMTSWTADRWRQVTTSSESPDAETRATSSESPDALLSTPPRIGGGISEELPLGDKGGA